VTALLAAPLAMAPMMGVAFAAQWWGDAYLRAMIGRGFP